MSFDAHGIRTTIAELIAGSGGIRVTDFVPGTLAPPCAVVLWPTDVTPATQTDRWDYEIPVRVVVPANADAPAQAELDRLVQLVVDRLNGNHATVSVLVRGVTDYGEVDLGQPGAAATRLQGLAATVNLRVLD